MLGSTITSFCCVLCTGGGGGIAILSLYLTIIITLQVVFGERKCRPTIMDQGVAEAIFSCQDDSSFKTLLGGTLCTDDFYEGKINPKKIAMELYRAHALRPPCFCILDITMLLATFIYAY